MGISGRRGGCLLATLLAVGLVASACSGAAERPESHAAAPDRAYSVAASSTVKVVAAGDIACAPGDATTTTTCQQDATAALTKRLGPDLVLPLGDLQYESGSIDDFQGSYAKSWGQLLPRTRPIPGNHEYRTPAATGYYSYFKDRQPGPPGYYKVVAKKWSIYLLNSNCTQIDCATQARWLDRQMDASPTKCSIVAMHHPRYSSGYEHGNNTAVTGLWKVAYRHRNDVVLSGHDHDYERFQRMDPWGKVRPRKGMVQYVSGAGGKSLYHLGTRKRGSAYFQSDAPGVLELRLRSRSWSWAFHSVDGAILDAGSTRCR